MDAILQCIANDFHAHIQFLQNGNSENDIPRISDTSKQTVEFLLLIHSLTNIEPGSEILGVPASDIKEIIFPDFIRRTIIGVNPEIDNYQVIQISNNQEILLLIINNNRIKFLTTTKNQIRHPECMK